MVIIKEVITILKPVLVTILAGNKPPNPREIGQILLMLNPVRWQHNSSRPGLKVANSSNDSINSNFNSNNNNNRKWLGRKKKVQLSVLPDVKLGLNLAFFMAASLSRELPVIPRAPAGQAAAAALFITMNRPAQPLD